MEAGDYSALDQLSVLQASVRKLEIRLLAVFVAAH
jgi:hypothetical protein